MAIIFHDDILVPKVDFGNTSNHNKVSIIAGETASNSTYTLPLAVPTTDGKVLSTFSSGKLTWIDGVTRDYLSARAANLISNFNGLFGDNSNFSEFVYDPLNFKNSPAAFKIEGSHLNLATDEFIAVEPTERYELTTWARQSVASGKYYMGIRCYDVDGNQIRIYNNSYQPGTTTQLTHDLLAGGTHITVTSTNGWHDGNSSFRRSIIIWDHTTQAGYTFPEETYSQNVILEAYSAGSGFNGTTPISGLHHDIDTIFLSEAWGGPTIPAGTKISNGNGYDSGVPSFSGGTSDGGSDQFVYCMPTIKNDQVGTAWAKHTGYIEGIVSAGGNTFSATNSLENRHKFLIGTAKVKIGWHAQQDYTSGDNLTTIFFTNLLFRRHKEYIVLPDASDPSTGFDAGLIGGMTVSNTKFGYLSSLTGNVQSQLSAGASNTTANAAAITAIQATLKDDTGGGGKGVYSDSGKSQSSSYLSISSSTATMQAGSNTKIAAEESSPGTLTMSVQAGGSGNEVSVDAITIAGSSSVHNAITTFNQKAVFSMQADFNSTANFNSTVDLNGNATGISTSEVTEGTNLYYTDARAQAAVTAGANITITSGEIAASTNTADVQTYLSGGSATTIETSGDVTVGGNLIVSGTQTQLNTTTLEVEDINIVVGKLATTSTLTNGAGLTFGAWSSGTIPMLTWDHANTRLSSNKNFYAPIIKTGGIHLDNGGSPVVVTSPIEINFQIDGDDRLDITTSGITVGGNINLTGTVDGIDIATDVAANTAKTGITSGQASAITANTAKTGITSGQASAITANTAKVSNVSTALTVTRTNNTLFIGSDGNTIYLPIATTSLWGVMSDEMVVALNANTAKTSFPGLGTTSTTALAGDTSLLALGTSSTTALAGDTTTISSAQASAITANTAKISYSTAASDAVALNTAKTGITSTQATEIEDNTEKVGISPSQAAAITANTAKVSNIVQTTITGNAGSATQLEQTVTIGGEDFDGDQSINLPGVNIAGTQNTSGNAATATILATARNIGGVSFNGSAAITLPGVNAAGTQDTSGNAATATKIASITNTDIVQLAGAQTLSGVKTFSSSIVSPGITSASNGDIVIDPHGTGSISLVADEIKFITGSSGFHGTVLKLFESGLLDGSYFYLAAPVSMDASWGLTVPDEDGTAGQVMKTDGSGTLSWTSVLDGTNDTLLATTSVKAFAGTDGRIAFYENGNVNYVLLQAHDDLASNYTLRLPTADGSANQTLKTDGSGNLGWSTPSSGGAVDMPLMTLGGRVQHSTTYDNRMIICGGAYGPTYYMWSSPAGVTTSGGGTVDSTTFTLSTSYQHYGAIRVPTAGQIKVDFLAKPLNSSSYSKPYVLQVWEFTPAIDTTSGPTCTLRGKADMTSSSSTSRLASATITTTSDVAAGSYIFVTIGMDAQTLTATAYQYMNINLSILA